MFGAINSAQLSAMRLALIVLCIGAASFLLRVLVALVKELRSSANSEMKLHRSSFHHQSRRGDLIVMQPEAVTRRFKAKAG
jgi:hypothetical protein